MQTERHKHGQRHGKAPAQRQPRESDNQITKREVEDIEERSSPRTPVIYEIVRRLGEEEMARPALALVVRRRRRHLDQLFAAGAGNPADPSARRAWRPLVADLGYSVGFVMVVMSRQQLFTENTVTACCR